MNRPHALSICLALVLTLAACTSPTPGTRSTQATAASPSSVALADFCRVAQTVTGNTTLQAENELYGDYDAFVLSKPAVRPLATRQYAWYEDEAKTRMRMISCKMKTADHIRTEYGPQAAGEESTCAAVNARTLREVLGSLSGAERRRLRFDRGRDVVLDPDELTNMGPEWLKPYPMVYLARNGALHIRAKGMRNDWLDERYLKAPPQFRGTRYCHLIAPDYLRRILVGEVRLPPPAG